MKPTDPRAARILVVDDDEGQRRALGRCFSVYEYKNTDIVDSVEIALEKLKHSTYDCIVSDHEMMRGKQTGLQLLRLVRSSEPHRDVPFVLITGSIDHELEKRAREAGATRFVSKLSGCDALIDAVHTALSG